MSDLLHLWIADEKLSHAHTKNNAVGYEISLRKIQQRTAELKSQAQDYWGEGELAHHGDREKILEVIDWVVFGKKPEKKEKP